MIVGLHSSIRLGSTLFAVLIGLNILTIGGIAFRVVKYRRRSRRLAFQFRTGEIKSFEDYRRRALQVDVWEKVIPMLTVAFVVVLFDAVAFFSLRTGPAQIAALTSYLDSVQSGDLKAAYGKLCETDQQEEALQAFAGRQSARPMLADYEILGHPRQESLGMQFYYPVIPSSSVVDVDLRFIDGTRRKERFGVRGDYGATICVSQVPAEDGAPE